MTALIRAAGGFMIYIHQINKIILLLVFLMTEVYFFCTS